MPADKVRMRATDGAEGNTAVKTVLRTAAALTALLWLGAASAGDQDIAMETSAVEVAPSGTLICPIENALVSYIMFDGGNPLLCNYRAADPKIGVQFTVKLLAQVEGAPTDRKNVAVWSVYAPPGSDVGALKGEYFPTENRELSNGKVILLPAKPDVLEKAVATIVHNVPAEYRSVDRPPRNMAKWVAEMRL